MVGEEHLNYVKILGQSSVPDLCAVMDGRASAQTPTSTVR